MNVTLTRIVERNDATLGVLTIDGYPRMVTLEPRWVNNQPNISCIPVGSYKLKRHESPRFGATWLVTDVPDRSHILIHRGNTAQDTQGCILVGRTYAPTVGASRIMESSDAFEWLNTHLRGTDEAEFYITQAYD